MIKEFFQAQIDYYPALTEDVLDRAEFKTVWSGKRMIPGDRLLYALVYVKNTDDLKMITFLERELEEIGGKFKFIGNRNDLPIIAFNDDTKKRD